MRKYGTMRTFNDLKVQSEGFRTYPILWEFSSKYFYKEMKRKVTYCLDFC